MMNFYRTLLATALVSQTLIAHAQNDFEVLPPPGGRVLIGPNAMPTDSGVEGQVLTTDGNGVTRWSSPTATSVPDYLDRQGPTIEVTLPDDWAQSTSAAITLRDPSGLATRAATLVNPDIAEEVFNGLDMSAFLVPTTEATLRFDFVDATALLGSGSTLLVVAQDEFGNFSRKSVVAKANSAIRTGTYVLDTPFTSGALIGEHCPFIETGIDPSTVTLVVDSIQVGAATSYYSNFPADNPCMGGRLCLTLNAGEIVAGFLGGDGLDYNVCGATAAVELTDLATTVVATPVLLSSGASANGYSYALGSSIVATFPSETPTRVIADIEVHCFTQRFDAPALGCPINSFENCDVDTFGPFRVEGTLQDE